MLVDLFVLIDFIKIATEPHKTVQKTTKACHKGIKKLRFLDDFGVFSAYYKLDCELAGTRTQGPYIKSVLLYQLSYQF